MAVYTLVGDTPKPKTGGIIDLLQSAIDKNPNISLDELSYILQQNLVMGDDLKQAEKFIDEYYLKKINDIYSGLNNGSMSGTEAQNIAAQTGISATNPGVQDSINNQIAQDNAKEAYDREIQARDTSLTSTIQQLQNAGMNPGSAISLGGSALGNVGQASSVSSSAPGLAQQAKLNEYNQKQRMTRQLISMAGSLAAAGIGGASYGLARGAAVRAAAATVGSAKTALNGFKKKIVKDRGHEDDPDSWYIY